MSEPWNLASDHVCQMPYSPVEEEHCPECDSLTPGHSHICSRRETKSRESNGGRKLNPNTLEEAKHAQLALQDAYHCLEPLENPLAAMYLLKAVHALGNVVEWLKEVNE